MKRFWQITEDFGSGDVAFLDMTAKERSTVIDRQAFLWDDVEVDHSSDHEEITDYTSMELYGTQGLIDYRFVRDIIRQKVEDIGDGAYQGTQITPPGSPNEGEWWLVGGPVAVGAWLTHEGEIAIWESSAWKFIDNTSNKPDKEVAGFHLISDDTDKDVSAQLAIGMISQQEAVLDTEALRDEKAKVEVKMKNCLSNRFKYFCFLTCTKLIENNREVSVQITVNSFDKLYKDHGIFGVYSGDTVEGLLDYVNGTSGTSFSGIGIVDKSWTTILGENMSDFTDTLNDKLVGEGLSPSDLSKIN
jgi:hypothetical protein